MHRSDRLLRILDEYARIVVLTHDTPDPDAIASGWALVTLVRERLGKPVRLVGGGAILRAENVYMVDLLKPPLELVASYEPEDGTAPVLVDCSPEGVNQLLAGGGVKPVAVIDHHKATRKMIRVRFRDLRPRAAASAVIASSYLREQGLQPSRELATALTYAIHTEIVGTPVRFSRLERGLLTWLGESVDHQVLRQIAEAPLSRRYFEDLVAALRGTLLYGGVAFCLLEDAGSGEIVGEVADLLIRSVEVSRVLCGALVDGNLVFSARTTEEAGDAVSLLGGALRGLGHWGGHPHRAGGRILASDQGKPLTQCLIDEVKARWLRTCGVNGGRGTRLVRRKE